MGTKIEGENGRYVPPSSTLSCKKCGERVTVDQGTLFKMKKDYETAFGKTFNPNEVELLCGQCMKKYFQ